ncbi:MAG: flavodoxin [Frankiales bacterium]|nr:flavodoxin [Frankiales bacterium]
MKALVVYGSTRGGTAGLAEMIAESFHRHGWTAEVRPARVDGPVAPADIAIVGGALYNGRWHPDARAFVRSHRADLRLRPVWLFSSGPLDDSARRGDIAAVAQVQRIAADLEARGHMTFGGRLEPNARGLLARMMARRMAGDWRDATHVEEWVNEICRAMAPPVITLPEQRDRRVIDVRDAAEQEAASAQQR